MTNELKKIALKVLISYAVDLEKQPAALQIVEHYRSHLPAMRVFRCYYEQLPEAREEMACELRIVAENLGVYLFALKTETSVHLYVSSSEDTVYVGDQAEVLEDLELLKFFGYQSVKDYLKRRPASFEALPVFDAQDERYTKCLVCGVADGAFHLLGCPVEVCPWCEGQLNHCNCRFDQLGVAELDSEALLERFAYRLRQQGRIAFTRGQGPAYPVAGADTPVCSGLD